MYIGVDVIGETGAGKTTFADGLLGFDGKNGLLREQEYEVYEMVPEKKTAGEKTFGTRVVQVKSGEDTYLFKVHPGMSSSDAVGEVKGNVYVSEDVFARMYHRNSIPILVVNVASGEYSRARDLLNEYYSNHYGENAPAPVILLTHTDQIDGIEVLRRQKIIQGIVETILDDYKISGETLYVGINAKEFKEKDARKYEHPVNAVMEAIKSNMQDYLA